MKNLRGFTLLELMVVVGIIALIAAVAIPNLFRAKVHANESAAQATLKTISAALETYATTNNRYPSTTSELLTAGPPYLSLDYFNGAHNGYLYSGLLADYSYTITAVPVSVSAGVGSYTITTGGVLQSL